MKEFAAYVFYVNRPDLLIRSINYFPDTWDYLTIVDNSVDGMPISTGVTSKENYSLSPRLYRPPVPLSYSQSMNWILRDAKNKEAKFILHFHSDATSSNPLAVSQLLEYARKVREERKRWACLWTNYDLLWAVNPAACVDIGGWDTTFPAYFVDQDMKRRWRLAGWETIDTHIEGITHEGSSTVNSDPKLKFVNSVTFELYEKLYRRKWAGDPEKEKYDVPYGRSDLFS
jgi:hypothetical protein